MVFSSHSIPSTRARTILGGIALALLTTSCAATTTEIVGDAVVAAPTARVALAEPAAESPTAVESVVADAAEDQAGPEPTSEPTAVPTAEPVSVIAIDNTIYDPGTTVQISYELVEALTPNAWIGVIPSSVPHGDEDAADASDTAWLWLTDGTADVSLPAPAQAGEYDIRIFSDTGPDAQELVSVTFTVPEPEWDVEMTLDSETYAPGEEITVEFTGVTDVQSSAWFGVIPSNIEHGNETENDAHDSSYSYVTTGDDDGDGAGSVTLTAPSEPGQYDVRLNSSDANGVEIAFVSFTVR